MGQVDINAINLENTWNENKLLQLRPWNRESVVAWRLPDICLTPLLLAASPSLQVVCPEGTHDAGKHITDTLIVRLHCIHNSLGTAYKHYLV